jgi:hypothetical protein
MIETAAAIFLVVMLASMTIYSLWALTHPIRD